MNICFLVGNLTAEPQKVNNLDLIRFGIAVNASYTKADGTRPTDFFNIAVWGKYGESCLKYLHKGSKVAVVGKMQNRIYEKDGVKKYMNEIIATDIEFLNPIQTEKPDPIFENYEDECPF